MKIVWFDEAYAMRLSEKCYIPKTAYLLHLFTFLYEGTTKVKGSSRPEVLGS